MYFEVIFDVETKKFFDEITGTDPGDLGVSIVSVYSRTVDENLQEISGKMESYFENDFPKLFELFGKADRIIGFNTLHFDMPALQPYTSINLTKLPNFDLMESVKSAIGHRLSLDSLAKETLNEEKNDHGANAVNYWKSGTPETLAKLKKYCEMDVEITRKLYDFGIKHRKLKYKDKWNTPREFEVDFSYPVKKEEIIQQTSLF